MSTTMSDPSWLPERPPKIGELVLVRSRPGQSALVPEPEERQRSRVQEELTRHEKSFSQLTLGFDADERRQIESDMKAWRTRLQQFERDLVTEPKRIRDFYNVRVTRVEPVGIVYLWPESN